MAVQSDFRIIPVASTLIAVMTALIIVAVMPTASHARMKAPCTSPLIIYWYPRHPIHTVEECKLVGGTVAGRYCCGNVDYFTCSQNCSEIVPRGPNVP